MEFQENNFTLGFGWMMDKMCDMSSDYLQNKI